MYVACVKNMRKIFLSLIVFHIFLIGLSQDTIALPNENATGTRWVGSEQNFYSTAWKTQVVTNVSSPSMEIFRPDPALNNGTSVIIAPGGGLYVLGIMGEGTDVAKWLNTKGITAFVLKYRLVPTDGKNGVQQLADVSMKGASELEKKVAPVLPLAITDGLNAIAYIRDNAQKLEVDPNKIGFMGFSAGGSVTMGVTFNYNDRNRPDFIVPIYPWVTVLGKYSVPADAPPMLIICATDDPLGIAETSIDLYSAWLKAGKNPAIHMYSKGGHGFGMNIQNLPSDTWIERFHDWAVAEKIVVPRPKK